MFCYPCFGVFWCLWQVLDILGMSKEAQADVFETFDAELFALSRLNTTNIVKVCYEYESIIVFLSVRQ